MRSVGLVAGNIAGTFPAESEDIAAELKKYGFEVFTDFKNSHTRYMKNANEIFKNSDIAIVLGGDGTILAAARQCAKLGVPVLGLNFGHLGYLAEQKENKNEIIKAVCEKKYFTEDRMMLNVRVVRDNETVFETDALNDAVITKGSLSKIVHLILDIDKNYASDFYADGVIIATPTGSTAYSLSAGGPVAEPKLNIMMITPVCAHSTKIRPMVISDRQSVSVKVDIYHNEDVVLMCDGRDGFDLCDGDEVVVTKSELTTKLIRLRERNFFDILNRKMMER